jgi:hypothetical protein
MQYSVDQKGTKSEIAFKGKCRVVVGADDFFGGEESRCYRGPVLENPTWRRLFGEAKKSQAKTRDSHHDFFEGVYVGRVDSNGVTVLHLLLGS